MKSNGPSPAARSARCAGTSPVGRALGSCATCGGTCRRCGRSSGRRRRRAAGTTRRRRRGRRGRDGAAPPTRDGGRRPRAVVRDPVDHRLDARVEAGHVAAAGEDPDPHRRGHISRWDRGWAHTKRPASPCRRTVRDRAEHGLYPLPSHAPAEVAELADAADYKIRHFAGARAVGSSPTFGIRASACPAALARPEAGLAGRGSSVASVGAGASGRRCGPGSAVRPGYTASLRGNEESCTPAPPSSVCPTLPPTQRDSPAPSRAPVGPQGGG